MRILISTTIFPNREQPNRGIYILKQANELRKHAEVRVLSPLPYFPSFIPSKTYAAYGRVPAHDEIEGHTVSYPRFPVIPKLFQPLNGISLALFQYAPFRKIVKAFEPDVVLCFWAYPDGFANVLLSRAMGLPVCIGVLGSDINQMTQARPQRAMIRWALSSCDRVLSVSAALKDVMVDIGVPAEKIAVIPNGVETERFRPCDAGQARESLGLAREGRFITCVSRLSREKGLDTLISAFAQLPQGDARLLLVGDGGERGALETQAAKLGVRERVEFAGDRPHAEVPTWLAASDVVALPSRMEGCPNIVLEAMASGRPVVASRVGGVPELLTSEALGFMVEPDRPETLALALGRALDTAWDTDALASAGSARTWSTVVGEILEEFRRVNVAPGQRPATT